MLRTYLVVSCISFHSTWLFLELLYSVVVYSMLRSVRAIRDRTWVLFFCCFFGGGECSSNTQRLK